MFINTDEKLNPSRSTVLPHNHTLDDDDDDDDDGRGRQRR